jgi:hypothetical protein
MLLTWREQILEHPDKAMRDRLLALDDERIAEMAKLKELRAQEKRNAPPKRKVPQQPPVTRKRSATIKAWVEMQWEHQHEQQRGRDQEAKRKRRPRPIPSPERPRREFLEQLSLMASRTTSQSSAATE